MSEQEDAPRITDKRKKPKADPAPGMPTAEELLATTDGIEYNRQHDVHHAAEEERKDAETEFERQQREAEEDARRAAEFEALSDEEKEALLAQQAAEAEGVPFAGGGIKTDGETKKEIRTVFVVMVDLDGTAYAMPYEMFEADKHIVQQEPSGRQIYRSCAELMLDIETTETASATLRMMDAVAQVRANQAQTQALQQQLAKRGGGRARR